MAETTPPPELPAFVINMDTRPERFAALCEAFPDLKITRFPAICPPDRDGERGCRESHFAIIRMAKERGYPWVLIMEDDCAPFPYFKKEFPKAVADLWKVREWWDIYNGGPIFPLEIQHLYNNILYIRSCACTQFVIINSSAYDRIIGETNSIHIAIDHYYNNILMRYTISAPMLTYQTNSASDIQTGLSAGQTDVFMKAMRLINAHWKRTIDLEPSSGPA